MINLLFCGNSGVFDGMLTCTLSILKRSRTDEPFTFYAFTMDVSHVDPKFCPLSAEQTAFLREVVQRENPENRWITVDVGAHYRRELGGTVNETGPYSPYAMLRLFADLVEEMPEKLLYLDVDILLNRDIRLLYDMDVDGVEYACARDHYGKYLISPNYINSGVLLLNLQEIRRTGLFVKARETLRRKKLLFPDQSAIRMNTVSKKMLPQRFNDQKYLHAHTVVRHFSKRLFWLPYPHVANIKPWQVPTVFRTFRYRCFDDILLDYVYLKEKFERERNR